MTKKPAPNDPRYAAYQTAMAGMGMMGRAVADEVSAPRLDGTAHPREPAVRHPRSPRNPQNNVSIVDIRDDSAQELVDRIRNERESRDNEDDMCGVHCFTQRIRKTRVPSNFQIPDKYRKFDGLQDPEEWITDYLETVKIRGGTKSTAMQSIQLHLSGAARSWLRKLPNDSIDSWESFKNMFIHNFKSTCRRPVSLEGLRACRQKSRESIREYIQRWNIIRNSAEQVSDERAIDAFVDGLRRQDLIEVIGRLEPTTIGQLMDTANRWANGEDAMHTKRNRSPDDDRYRGNNPQRRRYRDYNGPGQVSAGFQSNNEQRDENSRGNGQREEYPRRQYDNNSRNAGQRDNYQRSNMSRGAAGSGKRDYRPGYSQNYPSAEETLNGPCQMHYTYDTQGKRVSNHTMRECRTFQNLQRVMNTSQQQAVQQGYAAGPRSEVHAPLPPPPALTNGSQSNQLRIEQPSNQNGEYIQSKGGVIMIQKCRPTNQAQKLITRQVNMATMAPPPTVEYLNWSDQHVGFDRSDHPPVVPRPRNAALVIPAVIEGFSVSRVFVDGGSSLNLIYADTLRKMNISLANLRPSDTRFHGVTPEKPNYPLGKITLDMQFGTPDNFRKEKIEFEVMDWPSQYHAIFGRPAYARFVAVRHYTYLLLKIPGPRGPITVKGSFAVSDQYDRDFHKISESFGMQAEYEATKLTTDHNVLPDVARSSQKQNFDTTKNTKEVQVHPIDPKKATFVASNLDVA